MSGYEGRQKFQIATPLETHWGKALCDKETCKKFTEGWRITVDRELVMPNGTKFGEAQYQYIKYKSDRHFTETILPENKVLFLFPPGQQCFEQHKRKIEGKMALFNRRVGREANGIITTRSAHQNTLEPQQYIDTWNEQAYQFEKQRDAG